MILDTSGLLAYFNSAEPLHQAVSNLLADESNLVVSPFVIAELGYIIGRRVGSRAETSVVAELASGAYSIAEFSRLDLLKATDVMNRFEDQPIGVTDASLVVLAEKHSTRRILTLDHRHFSVLRTTTGDVFEIVP